MKLGWPGSDRYVTTGRRGTDCLLFDSHSSSSMPGGCEKNLRRAVVPVDVDQEPVRPVHGDLYRVEDVKRLAVRVRVDADRVSFKR
jgi:hypothetical protein